MWAKTFSNIRVLKVNYFQLCPLALSVLDACYKFIHQHLELPAQLWRDVSVELRVFGWACFHHGPQPRGATGSAGILWRQLRSWIYATCGEGVRVGGQIYVRRPRTMTVHAGQQVARRRRPGRGPVRAAFCSAARTSCSAGRARFVVL